MVELRDYVDADLPMTLAIETDPVAMAELGGPRDEVPIRRVHVTRVAAEWYFTITDDGDAVGAIGIWDAGHGPETGWTVLPAHHGRGIASRALDLLLERARASGEFATVDAFPGVTNAPSNRLCETHGFVLLGAVDGEFAGNALRLNHWRLTF